MDFLVCLGEGVTCLGEPLLLGKGRLRLDELVTVEACFRSISWLGF